MEDHVHPEQLLLLAISIRGYLRFHFSVVPFTVSTMFWMLNSTAEIRHGFKEDRLFYELCYELQQFTIIRDKLYRPNKPLYRTSIDLIIYCVSFVVNDFPRN